MSGSGDESMRRRAALSALSVLAASTMWACGGGKGADAVEADADVDIDADADANAAMEAEPQTEALAALRSGSAVAAPQPWVWASAGTSTVATVPSITDFATVIASGTLAYAFHDTASSTTTDPVTGAVADTSRSAVLVPYRMCRFQVTNANWKAFCNDAGSSYYPSTSRTAGQYWAGGAYPSGKENHPVLFVSCVAAQAYCAWLETQISGYSFHVPTEGEWEYAALGGNSAYRYPWGTRASIVFNAATGTLSTPFNCNVECAAWLLTQASGSALTYYNNGSVSILSDGSALSADSAPVAKVLSISSSGSLVGWQYSGASLADFVDSDQFAGLVNLYGGFTTAVGSHDAGQSWCGCQDMAGNAYEWTSTLNTATRGAEAGATANCVKGGSWYATAASGMSTFRGEGRSASGAYHSVGLRIAARPK